MERQGATLSLMSTLAGLPLYRSYGFEPIEEVDIPLPDGVSVPGVAMEKALEPSASSTFADRTR